jgi:hypothetical protein
VYDILEVHEIDFWLQTVEMHIAYCITLVEMVMRRLLARMTCPSDFEILNRPASNAKSVCGAKNLDTLVSAYYCAENSGGWAVILDCMGGLCTLAPLSDLKRLTISAIFKPPPSIKTQLPDLVSVQNVFAAKFHELMVVYKGVLHRLSWRKREIITCKMYQRHYVFPTNIWQIFEKI